MGTSVDGRRKVNSRGVNSEVNRESAVSTRPIGDASREAPVTTQAVTTSVTTGRPPSGRNSIEAKAKRAAKILASHRKQLDRVRALARQLLRELEGPHA